MNVASWARKFFPFNHIATMSNTSNRWGLDYTPMRAIARGLVIGSIGTAVAVLPVLPLPTAWGAPATRLAELRLAVPAAAPGSLAAPATADAPALPFPASHLALRWRGDEGAEVAVRWRGAEGTTAWEPVTVDHDMSEESGEVFSSLLVTPGASSAQVRVRRGPVRDLRLVVLDAVDGPRRRVPVREAVAGAALNPDRQVGQPPVVTRAQWGADESLRSGTPEYAPVEKLIAHHTATGSHYDPDPAATIRGIYAYHTKSRGWSDIAYNFLVDAQGRVYEGRWARAYKPGEVPTGETTDGKGVVGAHTFGNNTGTAGISVLGNLSTESPSTAAVDGVVGFLAWKADRHGIDPLASDPYNNGTEATDRVYPNVAGHRDAALPGHGTACPGDRLWDKLPSIRTRVATAIAQAHGRTPGYWALGRDGGLYPFGQAQLHPGLAGQAVPSPAAAVASTKSGKGYWVLGATGKLVAFGDAAFFGSTETLRLNAPVVRIEPTASGLGYWVLGADGGIFTFGDAGFHGSTGAVKLNAPIVGMARTPTGNGYWLLGRDGGVFTFGDAAFHGSTGAIKLNAPVVSITPAATGRGYWLVASDGGVFSFGVPFYGSIPGLKVAGTPPSVQIRSTGTAKGYYVLGLDGGVFTFGDARFHGAQPGLAGPTAAVDLALMPDVRT
jgi:hypothetical protein